MWLLLAHIALGQAVDPAELALQLAEVAGEHRAVDRLVAGGHFDRSDPRVAAVLDLAEAERALSMGLAEAAMVLAAAVPEDSPLRTRALVVLAQAHEETGRLKSAVKSWRELHQSKARSELEADHALLAIARMYGSVDRWGEAETYASYVDADSPLRGAAVLILAEAAFHQGDLDLVRSGIARAVDLHGPVLADRWFEPALRAWTADQLRVLCWHPEAWRELELAEAEITHASASLDLLLASDDDDLWARLRDDDWPDAGIAAWIAQDPLLARPVALTRKLEAQQAQLFDAVDYRAEALRWARRRLAAALERTDEAADTLEEVRIRLTAEAAAPPYQQGSVQGRSEPQPLDFFCVLVIDHYDWSWGRGEFWFDETLVFAGENRCQQRR